MDPVAYRAQIRATVQGLSDRALDFQASRTVGGINAEEIDRELARRAQTSGADAIASRLFAGRYGEAS